MSDVIIPTWIVPEQETQELLDEGSSVFQAAFAPGLTQRQSYGGLRLKLSRRHSVRAEEKAQLIALLKSTRGAYSTVRTKVHFALRGSWPATELITNNTFGSGTTGFTAGTRWTLSVADRIARSTNTSIVGSAGQNLILSSAVSTTQYAPYIARIVVSAHNIPSGSLAVAIRNAASSLLATGTAFSSPGINNVVYTDAETSLRICLRDQADVGIAGEFVDIPYVSLSRCALTDDGVNLLQRSDQFDNVYWTTSNASITADVTTAPDGTATGDRLVEAATTSTHSVASTTVTISSSVLNYSLSCALTAGTGRTWGMLVIQETTGNTLLSAWFDLANGLVGTVSAGASWSNGRASIQSLGNGWYHCTVTGLKTNGATGLRALVQVASADNVSSYLGVGGNYISMWRATMSQSSVPARLVQTTSAASTGTSATGTSLNIKGLLPSTNGLLLPEDVFEINGELKTCTAALNSDASGLGYLQFEPALVRSPSNESPVIVLDPMGKFLVSNLKIENEFGTQAEVSYDLEHIYE